jgi:hypothetical protein
VEKTGTQGVELLMWLATRGALGDKVTEVHHRNYHIPISNTASGLMVRQHPASHAGRADRRPRGADRRAGSRHGRASGADARIHRTH